MRHDSPEVPGLADAAWQDPRAAGAYQQLISAFYGTMAARTGQSAAELFAEHPLAIKQARPSQGAHSPAASALDAWAAGSKIVDKATGKPAVLYHGTPDGRFDRFDPDMASSATKSRDAATGFFFTDDPDFALHFTELRVFDSLTGERIPTRSRSPEVKAVHLALKNPLDLRRITPAVAEAVAATQAMGRFTTAAQIRALGSSAAASKEIQMNVVLARPALEALGFDGIISKVKHDRKVRTEFIAFYPEQIKSATQNDGTFDRDDPSILSQGSKQTSSPAPAVRQAARAEFAAKTSPITRKPVFNIFDSEGQLLTTTHAADTAQQAVDLFNLVQVKKALAKPHSGIASTPADIAAKATRPAPTTNWRIQRGHQFTNLDADDAHLYHVTDAPTARRIIAEGLSPGRGQMFGGFYANYSNDKVFLTERSGVSYWQYKVEGQLEQRFERPPAVTVLRIPKARISADLLPDHVGSQDANAPAYFIAGQTIRQGQSHGASTGDRAWYRPATGEITLGEAADLSSLGHECGHFFLDMLANLSSRPNAPACIRGDMQAVLDWFGIRDGDFDAALDRWQSMSPSERRPHHERWATSFEQYLREGNAPSPALASMFELFRGWLGEVYETVAKLLQSMTHQAAPATAQDLTESVRGVMNRMLADASVDHTNHDSEFETGEEPQERLRPLRTTPTRTAT